MSHKENHNNDAPGQNKEYEIIVNTREKTWGEKKITFREVVGLAYDNPVFNDQIEYTVTYTKGEDKKPKGSLVDNESVNVKDGMIFDVERSDKS